MEASGRHGRFKGLRATRLTSGWPCCCCWGREGARKRQLVLPASRLHTGYRSSANCACAPSNSCLLQTDAIGCPSNCSFVPSQLVSLVPDQRSSFRQQILIRCQRQARSNNRSKTTSGSLSLYCKINNFQVGLATSNQATQSVPNERIKLRCKSNARPFSCNSFSSKKFSNSTSQGPQESDDDESVIHSLNLNASVCCTD